MIEIMYFVHGTTIDNLEKKLLVGPGSNHYEDTFCRKYSTDLLKTIKKAIDDKISEILRYGNCDGNI